MPLTKIDDRGLTTPVDLQDSEKLRFGTGNDFEVYHDGTNSIQFFDAQVGAVRFRTDVGNSARANLILGAGVDLYYDGSLKVETTATGTQFADRINFTGTGQKIDLIDNQQIRIGTGDDLTIEHDASNSRIRNTTGQLQIRSDTIALENNNGSGYATLTGISFADSGKARWGNNDDLQIYHDGSNTYLDNYTGNIEIRGNEFRAKSLSGSNEALIQASYNGDVNLWYDNVKKFETSSTGTLTTGVAKFITGNGSTASDDNVLHIVAGSTSDRGIKIGTGRSTGSSQNDGMGFIDAINAESGGYGSQLQLRVDGNRVMVIGYQGNNRVGVNADHPTSRFHVVDDSAAESIKTVHSNGTAGIGIGYNTIQTLGSNTNQEFYIRAKGNEKLRLGNNNNDVLGIEKDSRDVRFFTNAQGWSTQQFNMGGNFDMRVHRRRLNNGQNSVSTHNLFRLRRHNWGWGHFEIRIYETYYSGSYLTRCRVVGHGAAGDHYSIRTMDDKWTNGSSARWGAAVQTTTGSSSSPGDSTTYYCDVQATLPNYTYAICELIMVSGYQTDNASAGGSMATNSYTLWTP